MSTDRACRSDRAAGRAGLIPARSYHIGCRLIGVTRSANAKLKYEVDTEIVAVALFSRAHDAGASITRPWIDAELERLRSHSRTCLRRCETTASSVMAPITAARNTLADGWTTTTNATSATAASAKAKRGPTSPAISSTAPQTIVTFAPDTAVRCVSTRR